MHFVIVLCFLFMHASRFSDRFLMVFTVCALTHVFSQLRRHAQRNVGKEPSEYCECQWQESYCECQWQESQPKRRRCGQLQNAHVQRWTIVELGVVFCFCPRKTRFFRTGRLHRLSKTRLLQKGRRLPLRASCARHVSVL